MQAKARLVVEQQLLPATIEQLPVGTFIVSAPKGAVVAFNRKMREIWGADETSSSVLSQLQSGDFRIPTAR